MTLAMLAHFDSLFCFVRSGLCILCIPYALRSLLCYILFAVLNAYFRLKYCHLGRRREPTLLNLDPHALVDLDCHVERRSPP